MSIEVLPFGMRCNIDCKYCYQNAGRCLPENDVKHDKAKLLEIVKQIPDPWILFGGEPLLLPLADLEDLLRAGFERHGRTCVQTNGTLITPRHIELFIRYQTHVGMSIDGPGELNDARWAGTLEGTRKLTQRSLDAIDAIMATGNANLGPSFIVQLHRLNLADDRWPRLLEWFRELDAKGCRYLQYHLLDLDHEAEELYVEPAIVADRVAELFELSTSFVNLRVGEFDDMIKAQRGKHAATCVWHACDPWNTRSVEGLNGDGTPTQCGRATSNDGRDWLPARGDGTPSISRASGYEGARHHERQLALYVTPQEHGGCKDCRFWLLCQGHCPGSGLSTAADSQGDWRTRSTYCGVFKRLFTIAEARVQAIGEIPVSLRQDRDRIEAQLYRAWQAKEEPSLQMLVGAADGSRR